VLLVTAGIYQVSPLKRICLAKCRSPLAFLMTSWRNGYGGAVRMGAEHGLYCVGCCWLLFAILFPLGMMNIAVLVAITSLIFAEKVLPWGDRISWGGAAILVAYGVVVVFMPGVFPSLTSQPMTAHM
jgi:predicted metal-binding membrane protein